MIFQQATHGRIRLHVLPTKRFKTFAISLFAGIPLQESTVTRTALAPFVLRRGTAASRRRSHSGSSSTICMERASASTFTRGAAPRLSSSAWMSSTTGS